MNETCVAECRVEDGFEYEKETYKCTGTTKNGTFTLPPDTEALTCTPTTCDKSTAKLIDLNAKFEDGTCENKIYKDTCVAQCDDGFISNKKTYICETSGNFGPEEGNEINCEPSD